MPRNSPPTDMEALATRLAERFKAERDAGRPEAQALGQRVYHEALSALLSIPLPPKVQP